MSATLPRYAPLYGRHPSRRVHHPRPTRQRSLAEIVAERFLFLTDSRVGQFGPVADKITEAVESRYAALGAIRNLGSRRYVIAFTDTVTEACDALSREIERVQPFGIIDLFTADPAACTYPPETLRVVEGNVRMSALKQLGELPGEFPDR